MALTPRRPLIAAVALLWSLGTTASGDIPDRIHHEKFKTVYEQEKLASDAPRQAAAASYALYREALGQRYALEEQKRGLERQIAAQLGEIATLEADILALEEGIGTRQKRREDNEAALRKASAALAALD